MKIYTASGWPFRKDVDLINDRLKENGLNVISTWITEENGINTPQACAKDAIRDVDQVLEADLLLAVMLDDKYAYRGTWTEIGVALGSNKTIILVCPGTSNKLSDTRYDYSHYCMNNVFFWHPNIKHVTSIDEAIKTIKEL